MTLKLTWKMKSNREIFFEEREALTAEERCDLLMEECEHSILELEELFNQKIEENER